MKSRAEPGAAGLLKLAVSPGFWLAAQPARASSIAAASRRPIPCRWHAVSVIPKPPFPRPPMRARRQLQKLRLVPRLSQRRARKYDGRDTREPCFGGTLQPAAAGFPQGAEERLRI